MNVVEEFIKEKMGVAAPGEEEGLPGEQHPDERECREDIYKRQLISELNENYIAGFRNSRKQH